MRGDFTILAPRAWELAVLGTGAALVAAAACILASIVTRALIRRQVERRIGEIYERVREKAEAAVRADYREPPPEAFALYHTLRQELFELAQVGGAAQAVKDAVVRATATGAAPATVRAMPAVKGATVVAWHGPPETHDPPEPTPAAATAAEALKAAVEAFWEYWSRRSAVERQLREALRSLGAGAVVRDPQRRRRHPSG